MTEGAAVRARLQALFRANGFHVFGRAYSRFENTRNAIPGALNYASIPNNARFVAGGSPKRLTENKYFDTMYAKGYNINVYQTDFMNFCSGYERKIATCSTYNVTGIKPVEYLDLSDYTKSEIITKTFAKLSVMQAGLSHFYNVLRREALSRGYELPPWMLSNSSLVPARALHDLDSIASAAARAPAGEMFFAHLLIPHGPFMYEPSCSVRDPDGWDGDNDSAPLPPNTAESRVRRYTLYLEQVLCVESKLQEMFAGWRRAGVYDRLQIIIHGDHGSRIVLHEPIGSNRDRLLTSDYTDSFSTLFAVKAPGLEPAYDTRMVAIQDLLRSVAHEHPLDQLPAGGTEPYVLLENGASMLRQPMPDFGDPRGEHRLDLPQP